MRHKRGAVVVAAAVKKAAAAGSSLAKRTRTPSPPPPFADTVPAVDFYVGSFSPKRKRKPVEEEVEDE